VGNMKLNLFVMTGLILSVILANSASFAVGSKIKNDAITSANKVISDAKNGKNWLRNEYYFTYNFAQKPSIGTNILRIQIFDKKGNKTGSFDLKGTSDMTEMRDMGGGEQAFKKNKKNDYLLPVDSSMRGEWVVMVKFLLKKAEYGKYTIKFNI
jgi:hypothetical protein